MWVDRSAIGDSTRTIYQDCTSLIKVAALITKRVQAKAPWFNQPAARRHELSLPFRQAAVC